MLHFEAFFTLETYRKNPKKSELVDPGGDPQDPPDHVHERELSICHFVTGVSQVSVAQVLKSLPHC